MAILRAISIGCMALVGAILAPGAKGDDWNRKTVVTFTDPVEIPGVHLVGWGVLPAGTYVFKILDSQSDRHIIQILNKNETTVYATILAVPNYGLQAPGKTVITFSERAAGQPEALRGWFCPGRNWGEEFVYGKAKAVELAKASSTPVLFAPVEMPLEVAQSIKSVDEPVVRELQRAPIKAIKPAGEEAQLAAVVTSPPTQTEVAAVSPAPTTPEATLPATASPLPLMALLGFMTLGGVVAVRWITKRIH